MKVSLGTPEHGFLARNASVQVFLFLQNKETPMRGKNQEENEVAGEEKVADLWAISPVFSGFSPGEKYPDFWARSRGRGKMGKTQKCPVFKAFLYLVSYRRGFFPFMILLR